MAARLKLARLVVLAIAVALLPMSGCSPDKTPTKPPVTVGHVWSALGLGMNDIVFALAEYNGQLIAGGYFSSAGGVSANRVAAWNGSSWSALSSGMNNDVYTLTEYNGQMIAGGSF